MTSTSLQPKKSRGRRRWLAAACLAIAGAPAALATPVQDLKATEVATGLVQPVLAVSPFRDMHRLFIGEQGGTIRILKDGALLPVPFLDVTTRISQGGERGLLGLAFHPEYGVNGRFFISVTDLLGDTSVLEYAVSASNPDVADPVPVRQIYAQAQPYPNHNGGCLQFGIDGMLLLALGDGGGSFDPGGNSQNTQNGLGALLRFDVDLDPPFIPADNPFLGLGGDEAIFAYGLRNPWRFSVDPLLGDVWIGDVGQYEREELNVVPGASSGGVNFGWRCMEGSLCTSYDGCTCAGPDLTLPVHEVVHGVGDCAITGGYVYRGSRIPELYGRYVFGDYCSRRVRSLSWDGTAATDLRDHTQELAPMSGGSLAGLAAFGEDGAGELYICSHSTGTLYRIDQDCSATPYCSTLPNSTGFGGRIGSTEAPDLSTGAFTLEAWGLPPGTTGIFFYGLAPGETPVGDGYLCVANNGAGIFRFGPLMVGGNGRVAMPIDFAVAPAGFGPGAIQPFTSTYFQFWHRDAAGPLGTGSNFTRGLRVTFCP